MWKFAGPRETVAVDDPREVLDRKDKKPGIPNQRTVFVRLTHRRGRSHA